jgi:hypothetical protein
MAYPANARVPVQDRFWVGGCNTLSFPTDLAQGAYYWGENIVNRGGVIQTRPGRRLLFTLPGKLAQGLTIYRPFRQKEQLVWAIDGSVYWSEYPFTSYQQLIAIADVPAGQPATRTPIAFYKFSPQVFFCQAREELAHNQDGSITLLEQPVDVLIIQDGYTAAACWDNKKARHMKAGAPFNETAVGTAMSFSGSRLWVARAETIYASDLLAPRSFTEGTYLAEADGFKLPEPCTGLLETSLADALLCFSPFTITSIQSSVVDRTQWQSTPDFQKIISKDVGSVSAFSPVNQYGMPWFFSEVGWISLNEALNQYRSSRTNTQDNEMLRSKSNMSPLRSGICSVSFENWMLVGVPSGSRFNRHTWVMDGAPMSLLSSQAGACWAGIWTGTFPVQYATGEVQDVPRCFELAYSCSPATATDGSQSHIQLWEDFVEPRADHNDTAIACSWETKIFEVSQTGELSRFKYAEFDAVELTGEVFVQIYYAPIKGHYRKIYEVHLQAEIGMPGNDNYPVLSYNGTATDTILDSFKPQARTVRVPEISGSIDEKDACADTCGIESEYEHNVDKGFQLLINWQGQMGIRELRLFVEPYAQPGIGACTPDETTETNIVSAIGCLPPPVTCNFDVP